MKKIFILLFISTTCFSQNKIKIYGKLLTIEYNQKKNDTLQISGAKIQDAINFEKNKFIFSDYDGSFTIDVIDNYDKKKNFIFINFNGYKPLRIKYNYNQEFLKINLGNLIMSKL